MAEEISATTGKRRVLRIALVILMVLLAGLAGLVFRTLNAAGNFRKLTPRSDLACRRLEQGLIGAEDLAVDRERGIVFVSSTDRRGVAAGSVQRGDIYAFSLTDPEGTLVNLSATLIPDFRPHGIGLHIGDDGTRTLMAVSHPRDGGHRVEVFRVESGEPLALRHIRSVHHALLVAPNDVAPDGPNSFYVTNDHVDPPSFARDICDYLLCTRSNVLRVEGEQVEVVADHLEYANGVALSEDRTLLYVAETTGRAVRVFSREGGALRERKRIFVGTGVDNIDVSPDGTLWIGAHPKLLAFVEHEKNAENLSPSEVLRIESPRSEPGVETVWLDLGRELSGISVAAFVADERWSTTMLLGAVFEPFLLVCQPR